MGDEESECNVTNDSFEEVEVLRAVQTTQMNKTIQDNEELVDKLQGMQDVVGNLASCIQDLIVENDRRVIHLLSTNETYLG